MLLGRMREKEVSVLHHLEPHVDRRSFTDMSLCEPDSLGVSFSKGFYDEGTPKFILGYSVTGGKLWWSTGKSNGDLFDGERNFNVSLPIC